MKEGNLKDAIVRDFGSVEKFKEAMNTKTAAIQGSGWGWLVSAQFLVPCVIALTPPRLYVGLQQDYPKA